MRKLKIFLLLLPFLGLSNIHTIDSSHLYNNNIYNYVSNQVDNIELGFYKILSRNILPRSTGSLKKHLDIHLKLLSKKVNSGNKFNAECALKFSEMCKYHIKNLISALDESSQNAKIIVRLASNKLLINTFQKIVKEDYKQSLFFASNYFNMMKNKNNLTPDFLYSSQGHIRNTIQSSIDRVLRLANTHSRPQFRNFINNFILPVKHILDKPDHYTFLESSINNLNRTLYDFSFYMDKLEKVSKETKRRSNVMRNQWNLIHKHLVSK